MQTLHTPHRGTSGGGGLMEPLPRGFGMLRYFEPILPSVESLYLPILSTR